MYQQRDLVQCAVFAPSMGGNVNILFIYFLLQESDNEKEADPVFQEEEPCTQTEGKCVSFVQWQRIHVFERV